MRKSWIRASGVILTTLHLPFSFFKLHVRMYICVHVCLHACMYVFLWVHKYHSVHVGVTGQSAED